MISSVVIYPLIYHRNRDAGASCHFSARKSEEIMLVVVNPIVSAKPQILQFQAQQNQTIFGTKVIIHLYSHPVNLHPLF